MKRLHKIREFWTKDRAVLMVCIGIALSFWFLNKLSTSFRKTIPVKIEYNLPKEKTFSTPPPQYVMVTLQGTGWDMLSDRQEQVFLNLNEDSTQVFPMRSIVSQHLGTEVAGINMEQLTLDIEDAISKTLPIQANYLITCDRGFDLAENIQLTPSVVTVTGPKTLIDNLLAIKTDTLKIDNLKGSVTKKIGLSPNPILKYDVQEVQASLKAEQFTEKSMFIPIMVKNASQRLKFFPNKIKLDCTVALSRYVQLNPNNFEAVVDLKSDAFNPKNNTVAIVLIKQPDFVRNVKFTPKSAEFYFEK
jgi:YbbR domain-containing protein